jgi:hypothetical protein
MVRYIKYLLVPLLASMVVLLKKHWLLKVPGGIGFLLFAIAGGRVPPVSLVVVASSGSN